MAADVRLIYEVAKLYDIPCYNIGQQPELTAFRAFIGTRVQGSAQTAPVPAAAASRSTKRRAGPSPRLQRQHEANGPARSR